MKRIILIFTILFIISCAKTEILGEIILPYQTDTVVVKKQREFDWDDFPKDTTQVDTARVPIGFEPTVEDWDEINQQL